MFTAEGAQWSYAIFGPIGLPELLLILLLALLLFGGKKLPEVARAMGQAMRAFKDEATKLRRGVELEEERESIRRPIDVQSSTTATQPDKAAATVAKEPDKATIDLEQDT